MRSLRLLARSVAARRRPAAAMIEQQKRKGPELPLVPVKRQRHELLLGAAGSGPGAGQQQAAPGALLQAVSEVAGGRGPSARLPLPRALPPAVPHGPFARSAGRNETLSLELKQENTVKPARHPPVSAPFGARFQLPDRPARWR